MSDLYLIKGETLTAIADKIRELAPENWGGSNITPEDMYEAAIVDVWWAGYKYKVIDLTNQSFKPLSSNYYSIPSGYGKFVVNGTIAYGNTAITITELCLGYAVSVDGTGLIPTDNHIAIKRSGSYINLSVSYSSITFTGGTDICNARLIDIIYQNFTLL